MIEKNVERLCSFYVSDYHLEMIMIPFINKKIEDKNNIIICSEKDLSESIKQVVSKINLSEKSKEKILELDWKKSEGKNLKILKDRENIIFINGNEEYRKNIYKKIEKNENIKIVDCYNADIDEKKMKKIQETHSKILNTLGIGEF